MNRLLPPAMLALFVALLMLAVPNARDVAAQGDPTPTATPTSIVCSLVPSSEVPRRIPTSGTSGVTTSTLGITVTGGFIVDVNVRGLRGLHTFISDLDIALTSPTSTTVQLMGRSCFDEDNFNLNLDDEAPPGSWPCPPDDGGTYQPTGSLSDYFGETPGGEWMLTVTDNANGDTGQLDSWALEICYDTAPRDPTPTPTPAPPTPTPTPTPPPNAVTLSNTQVDPAAPNWAIPAAIAVIAIAALGIGARRMT